MHEHWENKRSRSPGMATERIDHLYTLARRSGVIGGKLVGAGGGGFLLVYARRPDDTRQAMAAAQARRAPVRLRVPGLLRRRVHVTERASGASLRVGIVGCGAVGTKRADALGRDALVGCYDVDPRASNALSRRFGGARVRLGRRAARA